jgi:hypothetical protein
VVPDGTLFLAEPLDLAERIEGDLGCTAAPIGLARSCPMWRWTPISEGIRFDGHTLIVRIRMPFQRRGRKRIVAPNGSGLTVATKPQPDGALMEAHARAWRWQKLLDDGVDTSVIEIAEAERLN